RPPGWKRRCRSWPRVAIKSAGAYYHGMDIASVEFLSSASIEAFADHPHVLDGSLGRTLAYSALAIMLGLRLWLGVIRDAGPARLVPYQLTALGAGFAGAFMVI